MNFTFNYFQDKNLLTDESRNLVLRVCSRLIVSERSRPRTVEVAQCLEKCLKSQVNTRFSLVDTNNTNL